MRQLLLCLLLALPAAAFERMAALHETVVSADEAGGAVGLFTYDHDADHWLGNIALAKLRVGIPDDGEVAWLGDAADRAVRNLPGGEGVEVTGTVAGRRLTVELLPSLRGRDTLRWEGSALVKLTCSPAAPLIVHCGMPGRVGVYFGDPRLPRRWDYLRQADLALAEPSNVELAGDAVTFATEGLPAVAVRSHLGRPVIDGKWLTVTAPPVAEGYLLLAFGDTADRAAELASEEPATLEAGIRTHWRELLASCFIETPEPKLDEAFRWAIINLEYAWVRPYGWIESLHHWGTFWTMQHSLAADWLGQTDRTREMLLTHAERLMPSGQVPDLDPSGRARVDFGGWNQFWCWSVQHYWRHTSDLEFLRQIEEPLRRVVDQTFAAHDPDGNGLLGFGQQIGNQEDYISTPHDGTSPTIAGIEMLRLRAEVATALGKDEEAAVLERRMWRSSDRLYADLWDPALGRFIYYRDPLGVAHLEGQYHTAIWPVLYGLTWAPGRAQRLMDHVADRLTGDEGQIYCSNNFPRHVRATVGSQDGMQQQPWATLGWAAVGDAERAVKPLQWCAKWVTSESNLGAWPEVAEDMPAYFSPPAGVFCWGTIEGLFGLRQPARPSDALRLAPCLPPAWPQARLATPEVTVTIRQSTDRRVVWIRTSRPTDVELAFWVPDDWVAADIRARNCVNLSGTTSWEPRRRVQVSFDCIGPTVEVIVDRRATRPAGQVPSWSTGESGFGPDNKPTIARHPDPIAVGWVAQPAQRENRSWWDDFHPRPLTEFGVAGQSLYAREILAQRPPALQLTADRRLVIEYDEDDMFGPPEVWIAGRPLAEGAGQGSLGRPLSEEVVATLAPGCNRVETQVLLSADGAWVDARALFAADADLRALAYARCHHVALPVDLLTDDDSWRTWRPWLAYGHQPWASLRPPLEGLDPEPEIRPDTAPGLSFANPRGRLLPISHQLDRPSVRIPLAGRASRVYLLLVPMLDNHDTFAPVGKVTVKCGDGTFWTFTLHFPGNLDWWGPRHRIGDFATHDTDWCDSLRHLAPESVMNIIELDLNGWRPVESVTVEAVGAYPCLAVAAVTTFGEPSDAALAALSPRARELAALAPRRLFGFDAPSLDGWELDGDAWGIRDSATDPWQRRGAGRYFADSLAHREQATGTIRSAPFEVTGSRLTFLTGGHGERCWFALVDAETGEELRRAGAPGMTGRLQTVTWELAGLRGRRVRFVAVDADDGPAYAWIAFDDLVMWP